MGKRAVLVGCNYPGTTTELYGCVNDVWAMHKILVGNFGFYEEDIKVLIDTDDRYPKPEAAAIFQALKDLILQSKSGDVLFFHYSGHGARVAAEPDDIDETGHDECIVTSDAKLINDDAFRFLVHKLPPNVTLTVVADSCHSGGLIEHVKEQIGESFKSSVKGGEGHCGKKEEDATPPDHIKDQCDGRGDVKILNRSVSEETLKKVLREKTGNAEESSDLKSMKINLREVFGEEYVSFEQGADSEQDKEGNGHGHGNGNGMSVLVSGCQSHQQSADLSYGTEAYGALTRAILHTISSASTDKPITNYELVTKAREFLRDNNYPQRPGLYCADANADAPFICRRPIETSS